MGISNPGGSSFTDILKWYDTTLAAPGRFDVTGIPQGYTLLRALLIARSSVSDNSDSGRLLFNGDSTAANYRYAVDFGGGLNGGGTADDNLVIGLTGNTALANSFVINEIFIPFYNVAGSYEKEAIVYYTRRETSTGMIVQQGGVYWENTAAINQITLQPDGYSTDNLVVDSRLQIWLYK